jgi:hypothetical protein
VSTPNQTNKTPPEIIVEILALLNDSRDKLVKTSLLLQDYQFEVDSAQRASAAENSTELMEKIKSKGDTCL